jgi:hypothetical protein
VRCIRNRNNTFTSLVILLGIGCVYALASRFNKSSNLGSPFSRRRGQDDGQRIYTCSKALIHLASAFFHHVSIHPGRASDLFITCWMSRLYFFLFFPLNFNRYAILFIFSLGRNSVLPQNLISFFHFFSLICMQSSFKRLQRGGGKGSKRVRLWESIPCI